MSPLNTRLPHSCPPGDLLGQRGYSHGGISVPPTSRAPLCHPFHQPPYLRSAILIFKKISNRPESSAFLKIVIHAIASPRVLHPSAGQSTGCCRSERGPAWPCLYCSPRPNLSVAPHLFGDIDRAPLMCWALGVGGHYGCLKLVFRPTLTYPLGSPLPAPPTCLLDMPTARSFPGVPCTSPPSGAPGWRRSRAQGRALCAHSLTDGPAASTPGLLSTVRCLRRPPSTMLSLLPLPPLGRPS